MVKAFKDFNSLKVIIIIKIFKEIRFELKLYISFKIDYNNYNLISFKDIL